MTLRIWPIRLHLVSVSNPPHKPIPPSDRFSDDPSSVDIPPALRQPADIPLHEIEQASARSTPKRRSRLGIALGCLLIAAGAGVGLWQWNRSNPEAPALAAIKQTWAKAVIAAGLDETSAKQNPEETDPSTRDVLAPENGSPTALATSAQPTESSGSAPSGSDDFDSANTSATNSAEPAPTQPTAPPTDQPPNRSTDPPTDAAKKADTLLNHRRYEEAKQEDLVALNPDSILRLQPEAQQAISAMLTKARIEGVQLGIISAFRTVEDQSHLYFDIKAERGQSAKDRAEVSAPPGYSEHHTGYAVDFIDQGRPETTLSQSFETTPAFQWLEKNAAFFNFELSFPKDSDSGVSYEPWHWRYVGNQESLELFYKD